MEFARRDCPSGKMESFNGPCPHRSIPVEMDESMTSSSLDLVLPPACLQCLGSAPAHQQQQQHQQQHQQHQHQQQHQQQQQHQHQHQHQHQQQQQQRQFGYRQTNQPEPCDRRFYDESGAARPSTSLPRLAQQNPHPGDLLPKGHGGGGGREGGGGVSGPHYRRPQDAGSSFYRCYGPVEDEDESLERPLPLLSDSNQGNWVEAQHLAAPPPGPPPRQGAFAQPCPCCSPRDPPCHNNVMSYPCKNHTPGNRPPPPERPAVLQRASPSSELIQEVSVGVGPSIQPPLGGSIRELKRTINLPDEYRNLFITYSVDAAKDMWPFVKFLTNHGFRPVTDLIDDPVRRMAINRWMDRFLNDKSVLIIVAISPRYKAVVEGEVDDDDHGLNTKYIYSQIQTEYIQQGSSNFRLVPVLFPNATKRHVPTWLQSTRIYRWPLEIQDLLLRLAREERYIIPPPGRDLTLTIRTL